MNIVVAVRCYNEEKNIERFMRGYDFADTIVVSDGGSTDDSLELLSAYPKVHLLHFDVQETINGETWNPDNPHTDFVLKAAKELKPDWLIFDDMDDVPNRLLKENAHFIFKDCRMPQVNAFRLYMWGDDQYFPYMNRSFDPWYKSLWAWRPDVVDIHVDLTLKHLTLLGISDNYCGVDIPMCLLHKSWHPDTVQAKADRYCKLGIDMGHPYTFAGNPSGLPDWAVE